MILPAFFHDDFVLKAQAAAIDIVVIFVIGGLYLGLSLLIFSVIEFLTRVQPLRRWRTGILTDIGYAVVSFFYPPFWRLIFYSLLGFSAIPALAPGPSIHGYWEFLGILLGVLFLRDLVIWTKHRIFHLRKAWFFHTVHHSSEEVNWLSTARFHPAEALFETGLEFSLYLALYTFGGVEVKILVAAKFIVWFYNFFIHSNCRWTFGPLGYVFVSPVYHRWHHSSDPVAQNKNFAAMFSIIDLMAGTFYMPKNRAPGSLGLSPEERAGYPGGFWGQLAWPFRETNGR